MQSPQFCGVMTESALCCCNTRMNRFCLLNSPASATLSFVESIPSFILSCNAESDICAHASSVSGTFVSFWGCPILLNSDRTMASFFLFKRAVLHVIAQSFSSKSFSLATSAFAVHSSQTRALISSFLLRHLLWASSNSSSNATFVFAAFISCL